jgi:hypothetical protein
MILKLAAVLKEGGMTKLWTYFWQWVWNRCITNQLCWFSSVDFVSCILYLSAVWVFKEMINFRCELQLVDGTGFDSDSYPVLILELVPKVRPGSFWFLLTGTGADSFNPPNQVLTQHWFESQFGFHKLRPWKHSTSRFQIVSVKYVEFGLFVDVHNLQMVLETIMIFIFILVDDRR